MAFLRQLHNGQAVALYPLERLPMTLGRDTACDIVVDDPTVSSVHAQIVLVEERYLLKDLNSTNGVRVKGDLVQNVALENGMEFSMGGAQFCFLSGEPDELEKTAKIRKSWIPGIYYTR